MSLSTKHRQAVVKLRLTRLNLGFRMILGEIRTIHGFLIATLRNAVQCSAGFKQEDFSQRPHAVDHDEVKFKMRTDRQSSRRQKKMKHRWC